MADTIRYSLSAKLYIDMTGTGATPSTAVTTCRDVSLKVTKTEAKLNSRASWWGMSRGTLREATFDVEFVDDSADPFLTQILADFHAVPGTQRRYWIKDAASGVGLDAMFEAMDMDDTQKLEDAVIYKFTMKPSYSGYGSVLPTWH